MLKSTSSRTEGKSRSSNRYSNFIEDMNSHFTCFTSIYFLILCVWTVFVQLGSASFCPRVPSHAPTKGCGMWNSSSFSGMPWCCPVALCCAVLCCVRGSSLNLVVNKNSLNYCSSSDKSKRRTKTVKKSLEPKWNQTFMYSPVHRREFRERMLEITLWDQARVREEESEFLGEVSKTPFCKLISFFFRGKIFALTCVRPALPCRSLSSWRRPSWTTSRTGTSYKPTMCPPSHFHVPPRTLNVGSSTERVRHGDCRVRLFLSYFTDACLTKPQILRDSLHVADGKAIKLHLHSNLYLYASTDWNISQGNKSRQGEFY